MTAARHVAGVNTRQEGTCGIVVQAVLAGQVEYWVQAMTPLGGPARGRISIRLGRVVLVLEDRDAQEVLTSARRQAGKLARQGFRASHAPRPWSRSLAA